MKSGVYLLVHIPARISNYTHYIMCGMKLFIHSQRLEWDKEVNPTLQWACDYLPMLGFKLNHVNKRTSRVISNGFTWRYLGQTFLKSSRISDKRAVRFPRPTTVIKCACYLYFTHSHAREHNIYLIQWNLSVTTASMIRFITCDLFSNLF